MHPYTTNAIAAQRRQDMQAEAAMQRLGRQAHSRRAIASPRSGRGFAAAGRGHKVPLQRLLGRWASRRALPTC